MDLFSRAALFLLLSFFAATAQATAYTPLTVTCPNFENYESADPNFIYSWGSNAAGGLHDTPSKCVGNFVTGLSSIQQVTFYAAFYSGNGSNPVTDATASVYLWSNIFSGPVASASIPASQFQPLSTWTAHDYAPITASWSTPFALSPTNVYILALCTSGQTGDAVYAIEGVESTGASAYCTGPQMSECNTQLAWANVGGFSVATEIYCAGDEAGDDGDDDTDPPPPPSASGSPSNSASTSKSASSSQSKAPSPSLKRKKIIG